MKVVPILLTLAMATSVQVVFAKDCTGIAALRSSGAKGKTASLANSFDQRQRSNPGAETPGCSSLNSVMGRLLAQKPVGGRRLEDDKPFDPAAAQADLDEALRDPDTGKRLAKLHDVKDENLRLYLEAAVLDEDGHYAARDLRVRQLQQRLQ
jgi:hypothetical protein